MYGFLSSMLSRFALLHPRIPDDWAENSARHRVTQWINPETKNAGPADWDWKGLTSKDVTLPALLKKNGYHTIFSGKAHFAPTES